MGFHIGGEGFSLPSPPFFWRDGVTVTYRLRLSVLLVQVQLLHPFEVSMNVESCNAFLLGAVFGLVLFDAIAFSYYFF